MEIRFPKPDDDGKPYIGELYLRKNEDGLIEIGFEKRNRKEDYTWTYIDPEELLKSLFLLGVISIEEFQHGK